MSKMSSERARSIEVAARYLVEHEAPYCCRPSRTCGECEAWKKARKQLTPEVVLELVETLRHKQDEIEKLEPLKIALKESLWLQTHYAESLNYIDQGRRKTFKNANAWIARLKEVGRL